MKKLLIITIFLYIHSSFSKNITIETSGDILIVALPVITGSTTLILGDKKGAWQFSKGFLVNGAVSFGLKSNIEKERPDMNGTNSFPLAHTSITFQSASFIQNKYGWKYGIPAYILAGAVIDIGSAYLFTTPYQQEHMELTYSNKEGNYLIGFRYKFQ